MVLVEELVVNPFYALAGILVHMVLSAFWLQKVCSRVPAGVLRLLCVAPVVIINSLIPFIFDDSVFNQLSKHRATAYNIFTAFLVSWLCNCKVLAYALNRGYLAKVKNWSYWKFLGVHLLPIQPKIVKPEDRSLDAEMEENFMHEIWFKFSEFARVALSFLIKNGVLVLLSVMIIKRWYIWPASPVFTAAVYNGLLMAWLGQIFDLMQVVALAVFGIVCEDAFNHPYLAVDLTELWGRRWNTMTAGVLKPLSYDIIRDGCFVRLPDEILAKLDRPKRPFWAIGLATIATFLLSGFFHLITFWYITHVWALGWLIFFAVYGPILILEGIVKFKVQSLLGARKIPRYIIMPLGIAYTMAVTCTFSSFWFVPPAKAAGVMSVIDYYQSRVLGPFAV